MKVDSVQAIEDESWRKGDSFCCNPSDAEKKCTLFMENGTMTSEAGLIPVLHSLCGRTAQSTFRLAKDTVCGLRITGIRCFTWIKLYTRSL